MLRVLSFALAVSLFINVESFAGWRRIGKLPRLIGINSGNSATKRRADAYGLKIIEPVAITQSIGNLQRQWWNEAIAKRTLKNIIDKDFPEESPILI